MKYGARNQIEAKVVEIKRGDVMSQVKLEIPSPCAMGSVLTSESIEEMGLKEGDRVRAVIKAIHVLLVKE